MKAMDKQMKQDHHQDESFTIAKLSTLFSLIIKRSFLRTHFRNPVKRPFHLDADSNIPVEFLSCTEVRFRS